jgi:hypothetical protein
MYLFSYNIVLVFSVIYVCIFRSYDARNNVSKTLKWTKSSPDPDPPSSPGLLSRWFSLRRCSQYDLDVRPNSKMPLLPEVY